jgi:SAM-dependent methyltransferase
MKTSNRNRALYNSQFYARQAANSLESAKVVAAQIYKLVEPQSVVDIGCGLGGWLRAFSELGVSKIRGLDGDHVDRSMLYIDPSTFTATNLAEPFRLAEKFDLAICLEVAEHLSPAAGARLVNACVSAAPIILFSAAVPGQGGTGHINEQWPDYWMVQFNERGFIMVDAVRTSIRDDRRVEWWYRQNPVLFVSQDSINRFPTLQQSLSSNGSMEWVHINMLRNAGVRNLFQHFRPALKDALRRRSAGFRARIQKSITRGAEQSSCS